MNRNAYICIHTPIPCSGVVATLWIDRKHTCHQTVPRPSAIICVDREYTKRHRERGQGYIYPICNNSSSIYTGDCICPHKTICVQTLLIYYIEIIRNL